MAATLDDLVDHARMEHRANGRDEERRRNLMPIQQFEHARQARHRTELTGRQCHRCGVSPIEAQRLVVDVKAQANRHARTVGPFPWGQLASGANRLDGLGNLVGGPLCGWRLLGPAIGGLQGEKAPCDNA